MKIEKRIHNLLEDSSFPSMILLDGHWGVGKTFYVKKSLKPYLDNIYSSSFKSYYLSLYGVSSLDDFKDRLLSVVLTKNERTGWFVQKSNAMADFSVQAFEGTRGVGKALGSIGSIVKQYYFNHLDNLLLFIDDLERISSDELKSVILGECLNLCENKRIKIVVIGNQEKIKSKADIEKAFSDVVSFSRTPLELISVLDKIYTDDRTLSNDQKQLIEEMLNKHKVDNIRVLRRAIERFNAISNLFNRDASLDYMLVDKNNFITSFSTCIAIYHYGFSSDEVVQTLNENPFLEHKTNGETDEDKQKDLLRNLVHPLRYNATEKHIRFFANYENTFTNIPVELKLPIAANELQEILDYKFRRNDDHWLNQRLPEFKRYIEDPDPTEFATWSRACSVYVFLIKNNYIDDALEVFISKVKDILKVFKFTNPDEINEQRRQLKYYTDSKDLNELLFDFLSNASSVSQNDQIVSYKNQFIESWGSVEKVAREKYMNVPFLQHFQKQDFGLMLDNWSNSDIDDFDTYVRGRYDFNNIEDFFSDELNSLKMLLDCLSLRKKSLPHGARLGILSEFESQICSIYDRLKENLEKKKISQEL